MCKFLYDKKRRKRRKKREKMPTSLGQLQKLQVRDKSRKREECMYLQQKRCQQSLSRHGAPSSTQADVATPSRLGSATERRQWHESKVWRGKILRWTLLPLFPSGHHVFLFRGLSKQRDPLLILRIWEFPILLYTFNILSTLSMWFVAGIFAVSGSEVAVVARLFWCSLVPFLIFPVSFFSDAVIIQTIANCLLNHFF